MTLTSLKRVGNLQVHVMTEFLSYPTIHYMSG